MLYLAPVGAVGLSLLAGLALFALLGKPPFAALELIFLEPLRSLRGVF
jgi:ABC-type uncharacterized transport system permease subunit